MKLLIIGGSDAGISAARLGSPWDPIQMGAQVWSRCQKEQVPVGDCKC
jgi:hypothetical protein